MCYIKEPTIIYILVFLQAKKAAAINGQSSSTPVTIKIEPKTTSTPSKTNSPKTPPVKKDATPTTTPPVKKETTTPTAKKDTAATPVIKKESTTPVTKKETTPVVIKKEPNTDASPSKRKSVNLDSDDDVPLVNYIIYYPLLFYVLLLFLGKKS